jgi:hypothetical protein
LEVHDEINLPDPSPSISTFEEFFPAKITLQKTENSSNIEFSPKLDSQFQKTPKCSCEIDQSQEEVPNSKMKEKNILKVNPKQLRLVDGRLQNVGFDADVFPTAVGTKKHHSCARSHSMSQKSFWGEVMYHILK